MWSTFDLGTITPGNFFLTVVAVLIFVCITIGIACYVIFSLSKHSDPEKLPNMRKRDFTIQELSQFNGSGPDGRILIAVNGNVFDVTNNGKEFYGKDGPYAIFAGRDASRSLTMFTTDIPPCNEEYDDLSDLTSDQMKSLKEWELQFRERYPLVGKLLSPSEPHHLYESADNEDSSQVDTLTGSAKPKTD
uniref:Membrane associated progesterone receptor n=2 Tax=Echinococcus granulosus TaxID=6210 RepID=A0A068WRM2_ECHGR|nr:membrane associated progesterone receptor [Echinococcus granulosus]